MFESIKNLFTSAAAKVVADKSEETQRQAEFLQAVITEFNTSPNRAFMDVAEQYYSKDNDIKDAKRMVIARDGETNQPVLQESKVLSNNKLNHNFLKKLTRQKIGYMLGKPFSLESTKAEDAHADEFFAAAKEILTKEFFKKLKNVGRDSIVKGIGWLLAYYDLDGKLCFKRIPAEEVVPIWSDLDHTELDAVIRQYSIINYDSGEKKVVKHVDYYTKQGVYYYHYDDSSTLKPRFEGQPQPHFTVKQTNPDTEGEDLVGVNWSRIPFIPFKYDPDEKSLLTRIKSLVDDYDKKTSGISNNIDDFPNAITVVKNYDGKNKEEFVHNKNQYRTIFVQGDGDARSLETPLNITEVEKHIERLREDIYEFGQGVNTANKDIKDTSGVALRFMYADLDMDCVDWACEFEWSLFQVLWFVQQHILNTQGIDYTDVDYSVIFNTDVIINETETIQNCFTSMGVISNKTIAVNHPWTKDATKELDDLKSEEIEDVEIESMYGTDPNASFNGQRAAKTT